jgi:hypothetical protein
MADTRAVTARAEPGRDAAREAAMRAVNVPAALEVLRDDPTADKVAIAP